MKKLLMTLSTALLAALSTTASALTEARYQLTQDQKEVLFIETVAENPNISAILQILKESGYAEFTEFSSGATNDIWCRITSRYQSPILRVECYESHPGPGVSFHDDFNPAKSGYAGLPGFIKQIREKTQRLATQ